MQPAPEERDAEGRSPEEMSTRRDSDRLREIDAKESNAGGLFPYDTVVGIVDEPGQLVGAVRELVASGVAEEDVTVLCGEDGVRRIDATGERKGMLARIFRVVDALGTEHEHTARHVEALEQGKFVVIVDSPDDVVKSRVRNALLPYGGHFINYYSRWSTETLAP